MPRVSLLHFLPGSLAGKTPLRYDNPRIVQQRSVSLLHDPDEQEPSNNLLIRSGY